MSRANTAPRLVTDRLVLNAHTLDDFDDLAAMWADPQVVRYIGATPHDRSSVRCTGNGLGVDHGSARQRLCF